MDTDPVPLSLEDPIVGLKQVTKAMVNKEVSKVFIALDVDNNTSKKINESCKKYNYQPLHIATKEELGSMCGIEVGAAIAATKK